MRLRGGAVLLWLVGCAGDDKPAQAEPIEATGGDTGADGGGAGSGGTGGTGTDTVDTGTAGGPRWLSWDGVETLTVDILADGLVECSFHWRTSGLHRATICDDCAFDFDVVGVVDEAASTCAGAAGFRKHRWWLEDTLYDDDALVAPGSLGDGDFTARAYTLTVDPTYDAPVAMTWELSAELR